MTTPGGAYRSDRLSQHYSPQRTPKRTPPRGPREFGWLVDRFAASTPGITHAVLVSSDGLLLYASGSMSADIADPLSATTSGIISLGHSIASLVGQAGCDQIMLKFPAGHFLFMAIGNLAGLAVLVGDGADLGTVAHRMARLVENVGHLLTPKLRDDLQQLSHHPKNSYDSKTR